MSYRMPQEHHVVEEPSKGVMGCARLRSVARAVCRLIAVRAPGKPEVKERTVYRDTARMACHCADGTGMQKGHPACARESNHMPWKKSRDSGGSPLTVGSTAARQIWPLGEVRSGIHKDRLGAPRS